MQFITNNQQLVTGNRQQPMQMLLIFNAF